MAKQQKAKQMKPMVLPRVRLSEFIRGFPEDENVVRVHVKSEEK